MSQLPHLTATDNPINVLSFNPNFSQLPFGLIEQMQAAALKLHANNNSSPISPITPNSPSQFTSLASNLSNLNGLTNLNGSASNGNRLTTTTKSSLNTFSVDALLGAAVKQQQHLNQNNNLIGSKFQTNLFNTSISSSSSSSSIESANHRKADKTKAKIKKNLKKNEISKKVNENADRSRSNTPERTELEERHETKCDQKSTSKTDLKLNSHKKQIDKSKSIKNNLDLKLESSLDANFDLDDDDLEDDENLNVCDDSMDYDNIKNGLNHESLQQLVHNYPFIDSMHRHLNVSPSTLLSTAALYNPLNSQLPPNFYSNFLPSLPLNASNEQLLNQTAATVAQNANSQNETKSNLINGQSSNVSNYFANVNWPFLTGPPFGSFSSLGNSKLFFFLPLNFTQLNEALY